MTGLDDETAERMAKRLTDDVMTYAQIEGLSPRGIATAGLRFGARAGYAARDAEVEELRAERDRLRNAVESTDRMVESFEKWCARALTAEATLVKVWEYVKEDPAFEPENEYARGVMGACAAIRRLLDEPPTEREMSTAERWLKFYALIARLRTKYGVEADR